MKTLRRTPFTLVELICAMLVMMVVALVIATAASSFYNGYRRSVTATEKLKERMAIDRIWDTTIANMLPFKWNDENNSSRYVFSGKSDELLVTTLRRVYGNDPSALLFIRIKVEDEQLVAIYSDYPMLPWEEDEPSAVTKREVIAEDVANVSFQYADRDEDNELEWLEEWEEEEHANLPLAIRMTVEWRNGTREYWLRRTCGVSYNSTFGNRAAATSSQATRANNSTRAGTRNRGAR
ncbi:MAG: prepilin-type N-terminal cleavage/methylation domain-containing protein [Lentisphaeria bacterium]|nr:prepilin-type N-terminal cleavage/methylation domain-containing protein [Lentisphaeria bacterium]